MTAYRRYALYFTPPEGPLARFGADWLGWDNAAGRDAGAAHWLADQDAITQTPRRYGFHATIKAPFRLSQGASLQALRIALQGFAIRRAAPVLPGLVVTAIGPFLALTASGPAPALDAMAAAAVREFERFRAGLSPEEIARRRPDQLDERGRALLRQWGYPHVMERFRFHMTLSGPLEPGQRDSLRETLQARIGDMITPPRSVDALSLMGEDAQGRFHLIERVPFGG